MSGSMNADLARKLVNYVANNPGKTVTEIEDSLPELKTMPNWFEFACEGTDVKEGFILRSDNGKIELGPVAYLIG